MPLTTSEANDVMRRMGRVFPTTIQMLTFKDANECMRELGESPDAPAFYNSGTIYVILDKADFDTCVMFVAHEIGHQFFDPGNIIPYYLVARLYAKKNALDRYHVKRAQQMVNIYSDIVVNNVVWNDKLFDAEFGVKTIEKAFEEFYKLKNAVLEFEHGDFNWMGQQPFNIVRGGMALGWMKRYAPARYKSTLDIMPGEMADYFRKIDFLIQERDFAVRKVQDYYKHAVAILESCGKAGLM